MSVNRWKSQRLIGSDVDNFYVDLYLLKQFYLAKYIAIDYSYLFFQKMSIVIFFINN